VIRKLTVILLGGVICLSGITPVLAHGSWATLQEYEKTTGKKIEKFNEAPMLKVKVAAGELPPVEERLPEEPLVVEPWEKIGKYGGTLRISMGISHHLKEPPLMLSRDCTKVIPNIYKKWEYSKDGKTLTFYLRKGLKWSDGAPVTADDFLFWWEDVILNDELTPVKPKEFMPGGKLMKVEKVDDYTIRWHFSKPYWNAHYYYIDLWTRYGLPKHALMKYHIKYNKNADELAKEHGYEHWWQLFNLVASMPGRGPENLNVQVPVLAPFVYKKLLSSGWIVMERNPYYYQVDTAGNQLPYIDKVLALPYWNVKSTEILKAKTVAGEIDWENWMGDISIYPILMKNAQKGKYQVWLTKQMYATQAGYYCNQNYDEDPVLGDILRDVRFRRALSLAINRDEINQTLYFGKGKPCQITCAPTCAFYKEDWTRAYAEYDPEKANQLLDEMGLNWDENHEYRLRPDGKTLTVEVIVATTHLPFYVPTTEMVSEYWKKIGIKVVTKPADLNYATEYISAAKHQISVGYWQDATTQGLIKYRGDQLRGSWFLASWAPKWQTWMDTNGEKGEEPPEWFKKHISTLDSVPYLSEKELNQAGEQVWQTQADKLLGIGTVGYLPAPLMAANGLKNIPGPDYFSVGNVTTMGLRHQRIQEWFWEK